MTRIAPAAAADLDDWAAMRAALWPDDDTGAHREDIARWIAADDEDSAAFVARDAPGRAIGFAEASIRRDYVNGCDEGPVAFL